jgi:hypothetical protein
MSGVSRDPSAAKAIDQSSSTGGQRNGGGALARPIRTHRGPSPTAPVVGAKLARHDRRQEYLEELSGEF